MTGRNRVLGHRNGEYVLFSFDNLIFRLAGRAVSWCSFAPDAVKVLVNMSGLSSIIPSFLLLLWNCDLVIFAADAVRIFRHSIVSSWECVAAVIISFFLVSEWS